MAHRLVNHKIVFPKTIVLDYYVLAQQHRKQHKHATSLLAVCELTGLLITMYCSLQVSFYLVFSCCSICIGSRLTFVLYLPRQFVHFSTPCLQPIGVECKLQIASQLHTHPQCTFILSLNLEFHPSYPFIHPIH